MKTEIIMIIIFDINYKYHQLILFIGKMHHLFNSIIILCFYCVLIIAQNIDESNDADLHLLSDDVSNRNQAYCLDGSKGGYYIRLGKQTNKWKIHIQGGGWCNTIESCYTKSNGNPLGSSLQWPSKLSQYVSSSGNTAKFYGLMDGNDTNPYGDWNFVWFTYCDGSSFTSNRDTPLVYNNTNIYLRGNGILKGILEELENQHHFLSSSTEVIVSGTSAGGLASLLHSSFIKSSFLNPNAVRLVIVPDAGFFLDHVNYTGQYAWRETIQSSIVPSLWNSTIGGPAGHQCLTTESHTAEQWKCYFAQYIYKYVTNVDGIWLLQSMYDSSQLNIAFGVSCNLNTTCNADQIAAIDQYHNDLRDTIVSTIYLAHESSRDGYYLTSCFQHEESCQPFDWYDIKINGLSPNETFHNWYTKSCKDSSCVAIDVDWPNNLSCAPYSSIHGAC